MKKLAKGQVDKKTSWLKDKFPKGPFTIEDKFAQKGNKISAGYDTFWEK